MVVGGGGVGCWVGGLDASSILQMEGVNLSLMESKEAEGMAGRPVNIISAYNLDQLPTTAGAYRLTSPQKHR